MKKSIVCSILFSMLAGYCHLDAQEISVSKTPAPTETIMANFKMNYNNAENPVWYTYQDDRDNVFYFVTFTRNGDQKRAYYKNDRHLNLLTVIPMEYCPRKIRNVATSLHPDFQIAEITYLQSIYGSFYHVTLTKGKKKKMERITMLFTPTGEVPSNENDSIYDIIEEIHVTPPAK